LEARQIAVLTVYNYHRNKLISSLRKAGIDEQSFNVDILTIDKSQGIDRDCIVLFLPSLLSNFKLMEVFTCNRTYLLRIDEE